MVSILNLKFLVLNEQKYDSGIEEFHNFFWSPLCYLFCNFSSGVDAHKRIENLFHCI